MVTKLMISAAAILFLAVQISGDMDVTIEYATSISLTCDSLALNVSDNMADIKRLYWILSDGSLVDSASSPPAGIILSSNAYRLNITKVTDDFFGYYHCVVLYKTDIVKVVRKGLNINGPDYTKLHDEYKRSALIGGIAAAVMLGIIGLGCIVWHFRFQKEEREDLYKERENNFEHNHAVYDNNAMEMEIKVPENEEIVNGELDEKL